VILSLFVKLEIRQSTRAAKPRRPKKGPKPRRPKKASRVSGKRASTDDGQIEGPVLDVLKELLAEQRTDDVVELVTKLVSRNEELEKLLFDMRHRKNHREGVSRNQLDLFIDKLAEEANADLAKANEKLQNVTKENAGRPKTSKPPKQPPARRPPPPNAPRVDNLIVVPDEERPCPKCGAERDCVGHETTEVIELIPAKIIVRCDRREILACRICEAELVRAPIGDKVISGGIYGSNLVAQLLVGKYWDSLPLPEAAAATAGPRYAELVDGGPDHLVHRAFGAPLAVPDSPGDSLDGDARRRHQPAGEGPPERPGPRRAVGLRGRRVGRRVHVHPDGQEQGTAPG